jgi:hypothetical protein
MVIGFLAVSAFRVFFIIVDFDDVTIKSGIKANSTPFYPMQKIDGKGQEPRRIPDFPIPVTIP